MSRVRGTRAVVSRKRAEAPTQPEPVVQDPAQTLGHHHSYAGLCVNCDNTPTCVFPRNPNTPILQCEECAIAERDAPASVQATAGRPRRQAPPVSIDVAARTALGLCCNCANLGPCTFPKPEGGVWHCEEYA